MARYIINAPAKINLFLHIVGRAPCGYHLIESVFAFVDLYDVLEVELGSKRRGVKFIRFSGIHRSDNTIQRSIGHMVRRCLSGVAENVYVKVLKNIPVSAGLAGGSVDAAAVIRLLGRLWGIDEKEANRVAFRVGSDVPVCLISKTAFVSGMGDHVEMVEDYSFPKHVVLAGPRVELSTKSVFQSFKPNEFSSSLGEAPQSSEEWLSVIERSRNDLTDVALSLVPEVQKILGALNKLEGCYLARMSGSGATCFALFFDENMANLAAEKLKAENEDWFVCKANIVQARHVANVIRA
ncbi:4-diphosphocytidyl-2-C-methyl-D-erythritol kinase [Anaplasma platys]|uniref:4-diphosphocytidyl-2-C-methyl-D-erythritol kinase n=1 Tax=Anaplasma platys TaxID=949 RepID=A0A858PY69_9RICK|nr:4-(cytidine 5'-diphospho)-2-C-methyl-D-erythritol kinase [Anaplasma platys]QJC27519.1 4-diphosphocytidyl-2-C-methyl-D-erythritol kinase [Anaplasma platys]